MTAALSGGFGLGLMMFLIISPITIFVIRVGLMGKHLLPVIITAWLSDACLTLAGIAFAAFITIQVSVAAGYAAPLGAGVLLVYALHCGRAAWRGDANEAVASIPLSLKVAVGTALALNWLNPQMMVESMVTVAVFSAPYSDTHRLVFASGFIAATGVYYISLAYTSKVLRPLLISNWFLRCFDGVAALILVASAILILSTIALPP
jgi:L-lysine exporter family protein LysE/ArgO